MNKQTTLAAVTLSLLLPTTPSDPNSKTTRRDVSIGKMDVAHGKGIDSNVDVQSLAHAKLEGQTLPAGFEVVRDRFNNGIVTTGDEIFALARKYAAGRGLQITVTPSTN